MQELNLDLRNYIPIKNKKVLDISTRLKDPAVCYVLVSQRKHNLIVVENAGMKYLIVHNSSRIGRINERKLRKKKQVLQPVLREEIYTIVKKNGFGLILDGVIRGGVV